jgi:hypothetical protein
MCRTVIGKVVIIFNWGKSRRFAEEPKVVNWYGNGEDSLYCCYYSQSRVL